MQSAPRQLCSFPPSLIRLPFSYKHGASPPNEVDMNKSFLKPSNLQQTSVCYQNEKNQTNKKETALEVRDPSAAVTLIKKRGHYSHLIVGLISLSEERPWLPAWHSEPFFPFTLSSSPSPRPCIYWNRSQWIPSVGGN